jgi:hypothetical protein
MKLILVAFFSGGVRKGDTNLIGGVRRRVQFFDLGIHKYQKVEKGSRSVVPNLFIDRAKFSNKIALRAKKGQ